MKIELVAGFIFCFLGGIAAYNPPMVLSKTQEQNIKKVDSVVFSEGKLFLGAQPTREDLEALKAQGVKRVINLRTLQEGDVVGKERLWLKQLDVEFIHFPISGSDINVSASQKLSSLLDQSEGVPTLLHCASGNRVGALLAIAYYQGKDVSIEEALEYGKKRGLRSLESQVEQLLRSLKKDKK